MKELCALILVLTTLLLPACGQKEDVTVVRLNEVTHSVFYAPFYAAMHLGFFAEEGLEIELTNGGGADKVMTAVLSGQADIGLAGPEACIYVLLEGREDYPVVFAQLTKRDGSFLVGRTDEAFSWEDLRGATILGGRKGGVPEIKSMVPFEPFDFYIKRKLYIHNMGHATCAYLGDTLGLAYICQAIDQDEIHIIVQNAMLESAMALSKKYGVALDKILLHITDLLHRFTNAALKDTCQRVGGDPGRKLSPDDRMIGSSKLALDQGVVPAYIAVGAAAAVRRYIHEAEGMEQSLENAGKVLSEVSGLDRNSPLAKMILDMYRMFLEGRSLGEIRRAADAVKAASLRDII